MKRFLIVVLILGSIFYGCGKEVDVKEKGTTIITKDTTNQTELLIKSYDVLIKKLESDNQSLINRMDSQINWINWISLLLMLFLGYLTFKSNKELNQIKQDAAELKKQIEDEIKEIRESKRDFKDNIRDFKDDFKKIIEEEKAEIYKNSEEIEKIKDYYTSILKKDTNEVENKSKPKTYEFVNKKIIEDKESDEAEILKYKERLKKLEKIVMPEDINILLSKASIFSIENKNDDAIELVELVLAKEPKNVEALFRLGYLYTNKEQYDIAIDYYKKAIEIKPDYYEAYNNWGWNLTLIAKTKENPEKENLLNESIEKYEKAIGYNGNYELAYINLGYSLGLIAITKKEETKKESLLKKAKEKLKYAIKINPKSFDALYLLGITNSELIKIKKEKEKEELLNEMLGYLNRVIAIKASAFEAYNTLGWAYGMQREYGEAIKCYKKAIEIKEDYVDAYENLIEALIITDKNEEAMEWIEKAMCLKKENKDDALVRWLRCVVELMEDVDGSESEKEFNKSLEKEFELTWSFEEIRDWTKGIDEEKRDRIEGWIGKMEAKRK